MDVDSDVLTFTGTLDRAPLPNWVNVDPEDRSVHGTPPKKGSYLLRINANDAKSGSAFSELTLKAE
jgi:hypothetical protein